MGRRLRRMTDYRTIYPYRRPHNNPLPPPTSQTADEEQQLPLEDEPTKVVCLTDMLSGPHLRRLLEDDDFYGRFVDDVQVEACKYDELVNIVVPRPNVDTAAGGVGKVFLHYAWRSAAYACKIMMDGSCWKGDQQIVARFYPEDKFAAGDYGWDHAALDKCLSRMRLH